MFRGNIGTRSGRNVLEGKSIHCDSAGFDNFDDYFTDSDSSSPDKTIVETVHQNEIKSFLTTEKAVLDGDTTNFKFPSRKRLSFKADANSESDFSSTNLFTPRNRMISKRGMQSFPGEEEEEEIIMPQQFQPLTDPAKKSFVENKSYNLGSSASETRYPHVISKRGMKSFPGDDDEEEGMGGVEGDDIPVFEIIDSSSPELIMEKIGDEQQRPLLLHGGKENQRNLGKIQNADHSKKSSQKSSSHISQSSMELSPKSIKSVPLQNWYIWDDSSSLINRAKLIITPYGICEDTAVPKNLKNLGTNLQVIDEDESQQEFQTNSAAKLPQLHIAEDSNTESSSENTKDREKKKKKKSSPRKKLKKSPEKKGSAKQIAKQNKVGNSFSNDNGFSESEETSTNEELIGARADEGSGKKKSLTGVDKSTGKKKSLTGIKSSGKKKSLTEDDQSSEETSPNEELRGTQADKSSGKKKSLNGIGKSSGKKKSLTGIEKNSGKKKSLTGIKNSGKKKSLTGIKSSGKKKSLTEDDQSSEETSPNEELAGTRADKSSGKKKSLPEFGQNSSIFKPFLISESEEETSTSTLTKTSSKKTVKSPMDKVRQKLSDIRKTSEPRIRVLPHSPKSKRTKISPRSKKQSPAKHRLRSANARSSSSSEEKRDSSSVSSEPVHRASKKKPRAKKVYLPRTKGKVSPLQANRPAVIRKGNKRKASDDPESNVPSKRARTNKTPKSNLLARVLASTEKEERVTSPIKQNKGISQQTSEDQSEPVLPANPDVPQSENEIFEAIKLPNDSSARETNTSLEDEALNRKASVIIDKIDILRMFDTTESSHTLVKTSEETEIISACAQSNSFDGSKTAHEKPEQKKYDSSLGTLPRKRRTSGPLASEDSLMVFNQGYPKRIFPEKSKSPAKSNRLSERRTSGPLASEDSLMVFNQDRPQKISAGKPRRPTKSYRLSGRRSSGPLLSEDSLVAFSKGYPKRISPEKPKSPAKSNRLSERRNSGPLFSEDSLMTYNKEYPKKSKAHEDPPDWRCEGCDGLIPHCLMTCVFCGFQRHGSLKDDSRQYNSNCEEGETEWQCESCNCLIPVSLKACIFCGSCLQEGSQDKKKKRFSKKLNETLEYEQNTPTNIRDKTSESQSPVLRKKSSSSVNKRSSFSKKANYTFNSYTNIKVDHRISYCVCSQSDVAMIGMMKIQRGGYRKKNCSLKEMFFTVLTGYVNVQVDDEERSLVCHDTFVVAKNGEYSIRNTAGRMASLIFTIIK